MPRQEFTKYCLYVGGIFDIIEAAHGAVGHGGRNRLKNKSQSFSLYMKLAMLVSFHLVVVVQIGP